MQGWIISIVCVNVLGVLLEIVLPNGKIAKYVKGVFSLLVIFVIVSPLPKLLRSEWKFDFSSAWASVNEGFVKETKDERTREKEEETKTYLALYGFDCEVSIELGADYGISEIEVIDFGKSGDVTEIIDLVANHLNVEKNKVKFILKEKREADV